MKRNHLLQIFLLFVSGLAFIILCTLGIAPGHSQMKIILFLTLALAVALWRLRPSPAWERGDALYGAVALLLGMLVSMYFKREYAPVWLTDSTALARAAALLKATPFALLGLLRWVGVICAVPFLTVCLKWGGKWTSLWKRLRFLVKPFFQLTLLYLVGISAILRANVPYNDDMGRIVEGYHQWDTFNRYLSTFLSNLIHGDWYLTDVSPLPQILAAMILAAAGVVMIHAVSEKKEISLWSLVASLPLGLSPYFLECFSYKYDAPYMALSILFSVVPVLWAKKGKLPCLIAAAVGTLGMCCTYQAASGIFPMLVLLLWLLRWERREGSPKERLRFVLFSALGYLSGLVLFKLFFMHPTDPGLYTVTEVPPLGEMIPTVVSNYRIYFALIHSDFRLEWRVMIWVMMACFIGLRMVHTKEHAAVAGLIGFAVTVLMLLLSFGVYPLLRGPIFTPRAMYGFGMFLCCMAVPLTLEKHPIARVLPLFLSFAFFSFAFTYGNALHEQYRYADFRIQTALQDLQEQELLQQGTVPYLQLEGSIGYAPAVRRMPEHYDLLRRLIPITFDGYGLWGRYAFFRYYDLRGVVWDNNEPDPSDLLLPVLKDTMYHTIRGNNERIVVQLK